MIPSAANLPSEPCDVLALGAHPDDVELFAGGTLALLAAQGKRVAAVALTRGECGSRGTVEQRAAEAHAAAKVLGVECGTLALPDSRLADCDEQRLAVAAALRLLRPRLLLTHAPDGRHPDHDATHTLVRSARFLANMARAPLAGERWEIPRTLFFAGNDTAYPAPASVIVTFGDSIFQIKLRALRAYGSQFAGSLDATDDRQAPTMIASPAYWRYIETRARFYGAMAGGEFGEPLYHDSPWPLASAAGLMP
jgi:N-acetylglucosamine malate deacetylase 1